MHKELSKLTGIAVTFLMHSVRSNLPHYPTCYLTYGNQHTLNSIQQPLMLLL